MSEESLAVKVGVLTAQVSGLVKDVDKLKRDMSDLTISANNQNSHSVAQIDALRNVVDSLEETVAGISEHIPHLIRLIQGIQGEDSILTRVKHMEDRCGNCFSPGISMQGLLDQINQLSSFNEEEVKPLIKFSAKATWVMAGAGAILVLQNWEGSLGALIKKAFSFFGG